ncbi:MAG: hypothetical protein GF416_07035 [Candidatus Altiarchaeales archaeon]|nr:hypothetical protein [Candidatus Altiarchaeales archaeon]MBD3416867.1 hypothetical protein [Candidatus Altiarchaeales archaeon]
MKKGNRKDENRRTRVGKYIRQVQHRLGYDSWRKAYVAFRAVIMALNDREAVRTKKSFLEEVDRNIGDSMETEHVVSGVFNVLEEKIANGEVMDFTPNLSSDLSEYWPIIENREGGVCA